MALSDYIKEQRQDCQNAIMEPIVENLSKYLVNELRTNRHAHIHWVYKKEKERVDEDYAFVYYTRKVALCDWLIEEGFRYRDAVCDLNGQVTGINVSL